MSPAERPRGFAEQRLQLLFDNLPDYAIFLVDLDGTISSWNTGVARVLGYTEAEFVGLPFSRLFTPEDIASDQPAREMAEAAAHGHSRDRRDHVKKDGTRFRADGVLTPLHDEASGWRGFSKIMHDVTSQHRAAEALRDSEERYRLLLDSVTDYAIFLLDADGRVASWTPAAARMMGYQAEEIIGAPIHIFFTPEDRARHLPEQELSAAAATGRFDGEGWRVRKDGTRFWGDEVTAPILTADGLRGYARVVRDLTDRQRAALEREQLYTQAQEANRLKDEFLGTISHELRTPLNAILGWTHLLESDELRFDPEKQRRALRAIARNAAAQAQLVNDLLDVSRIISGKMRLHITRVRLADVIQTSVESVLPAAQAKGVDVRLDLDPTLHQIPGDADRLQQVVWNLLSNAIKFTDTGGTVTVQTRRVDRGCELSVEDTGIGIHPEVLPYVFERFRQGDSSTGRRHGGVGLGLAIVRHLVELHGGRVEAQSPGPGRGTRIVVNLPVMVPTVTAAPLVSPELGALSRDVEMTLDGVRVLVVDDDEDAREVLATILTRRSAEVVVASSAAEGALAAQDRRPDVIIADIGMPDEDGYVFIRQLRETDRERLRNVPAIALTSYARAEDRERALQAGFQLHVAKPFDPRTVVDAVAHLAGRR
ncbi:MAG: PAS domain S-box protein [Vicinamibacterales bacterium]